MGVKGDKLTNDSVITAELLLEKLQTISGITSKKMFGGHGIFHNGKMFGIIDSKGNAFLKADESNKDVFDKAGSTKHGRMPYYTIPQEVFNDIDQLTEWAQKSIAIAK